MRRKTCEINILENTSWFHLMNKTQGTAFLCMFLESFILKGCAIVDLVTLFMLAVGLSMDAFAVSISNGMSYKDYRTRQVVMAALAFGLFQGLMPTIGFLGGRAFADLITAVDHWLALILLGFIGGKMVKEAVEELHDSSDDQKETDRTFTLKLLIVQAIATSIDALAVGISLAALNVNIFYAAGFITTVTTVVCLFGGALGKKFGEMLSTKATLAGGLILVGIGLKIFIEHVFM